jgi:hypothetical protein
MVVQRPRTVAQEHAGHRRAAGGDRDRTRQDGQHLPHVAFSGGDAVAAQRPALRPRYRRPACQVQDVLPALGPATPVFRR